MDYSQLVSAPNQTDTLEITDFNGLPRESIQSLLGFEKPKAILYVLSGEKEEDGIITSEFKFLNPYGAFETKLLCVDKHLTDTCIDAGKITALYQGIQMALLNQVQFLQVYYKDFPTLELFLGNGRLNNSVQIDLMNYLMWASQFVRLEFIADEETDN